MIILGSNRMYYIVIIVVVLLALIILLISRKEVSAKSINKRINIGICSPFIADGVLNIISQYSTNHPEVSIYLTCSNNESLCRAYRNNELDLLFLSSDVNFEGAKGDIEIEEEPLLSRYSSIVVEPYERKRVKLHVLSRCNEIGKLFIE